MIRFLLEGQDKLVTGFRDYKTKSDKALDNAVKKTALGIEADAKRNLKAGMVPNPKHKRTFRLLSSIYNRLIGSGERVVGTNVFYAPYIEFGTGDLVSIPQGTEEVAAQYRGKGIKKVNIRAVSFLHRAMMGQAKKHLERIKDEFNKIT